MEPMIPSVREEQPENGDTSKEEAVLPGPPASPRERLFRYVPALAALRNYSAAALRKDVVAGLTVAAVAVPPATAGHPHHRRVPPPRRQNPPCPAPRRPPT